jgi:hypothetical protein
MYKGTLGKIGGVVTFLEEILPFSDFILYPNVDLQPPHKKQNTLVDRSKS